MFSVGVSRSAAIAVRTRSARARPISSKYVRHQSERICAVLLVVNILEIQIVRRPFGVENCALSMLIHSKKCRI